MSVLDKIYKLNGMRFMDLYEEANLILTKYSRVFYVDSVTGSDSYSGRSIKSPLATLAAAYAQCTTSYYDVIVCLPTHSETFTAVLTMNKIGVQIAAMRAGNLRPVITINGAVDMFSFAAANQLIDGLETTIVTTDAATAIVNFAAAKCRARNLKVIPSSGTENVVDVFTLASGGDDGVIDNCEIHNTTVAVNSFVSIEAAVARFTIKDNYFSGAVATAGIIDADTATQLRFCGNLVKTVGTNIPACILDSNPTGNAYRNHMWGTDATIANNVNWGNALILGDNYVRGGTGSAASATNVIPALDT